MTMPSNEATFAMIDLGNSLRRIRGRLDDDAWRQFMADVWPGEDRFVGLLMEFARKMSDDPDYRDPIHAQVLADMAVTIRTFGKSSLHGMPYP
jgi:hypothetical protein